MPPALSRLFWLVNKFFMVPMFRLGLGRFLVSPFADRREGQGRGFEEHTSMRLRLKPPVRKIRKAWYWGIQRSAW